MCTKTCTRLGADELLHPTGIAMGREASVAARLLPCDTRINNDQIDFPQVPEWKSR
jgi:hypothetical protein